MKVFKFINEKIKKESFSFVIDRTVYSKDELLTLFKEKMNFPGYSRNNWDSFEECIQDLTWINEKYINIHHSELPLKNDPRELKIYLEILEAAMVMFDKDKDKVLEVTFLQKDKAFIERVLS